MSSIPMYLLQVLQPSKAVLQKLVRICDSFMWDKSTGVKGIHWIVWDKACFPTVEDGLGFRSFGDMKMAFACKLWWRLRKNDSIWAEFMHLKYIIR